MYYLALCSCTPCVVLAILLSEAVINLNLNQLKARNPTNPYIISKITAINCLTEFITIVNAVKIVRLVSEAQ